MNVKTNEKAIQEYKTIQPIALIPENVRRLICPLATNEELSMFIYMCQFYKIDPFIKEAYLIKYDKKDKATWFPSKDYYMKKADQQKDLRKIEAGVIVQDKPGNIKYEVGTVVLEGEKLIGGWSEVVRQGREPYKHRVPLKDYDTKRFLWNKMPATMIRKVALVQNLREAYPNVFSGLYDSSEMEQSMSNPSLESFNNSVPAEEIFTEPFPAEENFTEGKNSDISPGKPKITEEKKEKSDEKKEIVKLEDPELELGFSDPKSFQSDLLSMGYSKEFVFPPSDLNNLHEIASSDTPFRFIIRDTKFGNAKWTHFANKVGGKEDLSKDFLRVINKDKSAMTLFIDNNQGKLRIAQPTAELFGSDLKPYLKALAYGINFWIVISNIYDEMHLD